MYPHKIGGFCKYEPKKKTSTKEKRELLLEQIQFI